MDEIKIEENTTVVELPLKHQFGKLMFSSVAAFGANKLAEKAYDRALTIYRARKGS